MSESNLNDEEITRYARQMILPEIGDEGQEALKATKLGIIGAGGLGNPALMLAATAGFGHITIIDDDVVEATNLNRQFLFTPDDLAQPKAVIAAERAQAQNPHCHITAHRGSFDDSQAAGFVASHDIIIDASDNPETRYLANRHALACNRHLIFVSAIRFEGQLAVFAAPSKGQDTRHGCYECLFPKSTSPISVPNCATVGIAGPITTIMGAMAVLEALKLICPMRTGVTPLIGKLLLFDGLSYHHDILTTKRDKNCPACSQLHSDKKD